MKTRKSKAQVRRKALVSARRRRISSACRKQTTMRQRAQERADRRSQLAALVQRAGKEFLVQLLVAVALIALKWAVVEVLLALTIVQAYFRDLDRWQPGN